MTVYATYQTKDSEIASRVKYFARKHANRLGIIDAVYYDQERKIISVTDKRIALAFSTMVLKDREAVKRGRLEVFE